MISHKTFLSAATLAATMWLSSVTTVAQTAAAQASTALGRITGRVVNENGRPLPYARILLRRVDANNSETINTTSDREGRFEISGLQPLSYYIFAFLQGYAPLLRDDGPLDFYRVGDSVTLVLTKGGVITGAVTDNAGEPVVGVDVRASLLRGGKSLPFPYSQFGSSSPTDDRGIYRIYGLAEGTYVVWAGGGSQTNPSQDAFVDDVPTYAPAATRDTAQEIVVRAGVETTNVDIHYRGDSGHVVSGRASGPEISQFFISLTAASGPEWEKRTFQNPNRGFQLEAVDDGDYYLVATTFRSDGQLMVSPAKQIKVRNADVTGVELLVQPLSTIAGRLVLEEIKTTQCSDKQRPVFTETLVSAQSNGPTTLDRILKVPAAKTNADERGDFLLKNLPSGRYYFTTEYFAKDWYLKSLSLPPTESASPKPGKPIDASRTWTTLKPGERLNGLTITVAQGAASLVGRFSSSKGEASTERFYVHLVPTDKESLDDPLRFYVGPVTAEGRFALTNIAPGHYLVLAQRATDEFPSLTSLRSPDATASRLKLRRAAESLKTEVELKPCQRVTDLNLRQ